MKIGVIGLWHLGEVYSGCLAELGNNIVGFDNNRRVIENLNQGIVPLPEPKLEAIVQRNIKQGRLKFTADFRELADRDVIWFTVDVPVDNHDKADLKIIFSYIKKALPYMKNGSLLIISSQLPVGTSHEISIFIKSNRTKFKFDYAYIPENLPLGESVDSFLKPSRIVIGIDNNRRQKDLTQIFQKFKTSTLMVKVASAEMIKHATNAYLASSLSFIYDIADICEKVGADVTEVSCGLRADERIGRGAYLDASAGFSGGHLARDLQYLSGVAKEEKIELPVINSVIKKNIERRKIIFEKISPMLGASKDKTLTFLGITYKSGTPTLTRSLPLMVAKESLQRGAKINLCDPWVNKDEIIEEIPEDKFNYFSKPYESVKDSHAIICITPWGELKELDWQKIANSMVKPKIFFDARNFFAPMSGQIEKAGLNYIGIGR